MKQIIAIFFLSFYSFCLTGQTFTEKIPGTEVSFTLVLMPGGTFTMGSEGDSLSTEMNEWPAREVQLDSFWIGAHEVSYDMFNVFYQRELDGATSTHPAGDYDVDIVSRPSPQYIDYSYGMGKSGFPAVSMTQQAALRYCEWLYEKTGVFYRLPTEAEWEYACLAGAEAEPVINSLDSVAWYYENANEKYHELGQKQANAMGLYDMLGNVAEWTLDDYQDDYFKRLSSSPATNPWLLPAKKHFRTVKGGSYDSDPIDCRCKARMKSSPRWQARDPQIPKSKWWNPDSPFVGFRLVRPVKQLSEAAVAAFFEKAIKG